MPATKTKQRQHYNTQTVQNSKLLTSAWYYGFLQQANNCCSINDIVLEL